MKQIYLIVQVVALLCIASINGSGSSGGSGSGTSGSGTSGSGTSGSGTSGSGTSGSGTSGSGTSGSGTSGSGTSGSGTSGSGSNVNSTSGVSGNGTSVNGSGTVQQNSSCIIATRGGNSNGSCCYFPFVYQQKIYNNCTANQSNSFWCATTSSFDKDGMWGYCYGIWSDWSQWSKCNVSCGIGVMNKSRVCLNDSKLCDGESYNITTCFSNISCAGVWSDWSQWSDCNVSCGIGVMNKSRICFNDSKLCVGESFNVTTCFSNVNCAGVWSDWSEWSDCNVSCGIGVMNKLRICFNDSKLCVGESYIITTCFSNVSCAGVWSDWSEWSDCNVSCGIGVMNKSRICFNDSKLCVGESYNITTCFSDVICAGIWSDWSDWSDCNVSCGIGVMNKSRICFNGSKLCVGESYNITTCFSNISCAGVWSDWSEWSDCNVSCGIGVMNKSRICLNDNTLCVGESYNISTCFSNVSCAGVWSDWSQWSGCNVSCGIGVMNKSRICFNDSNLCVGESYSITTCFSNVSCAGIWSDWSEWSDCNVSCGIGVMNKSRICFNDSKLCVGKSYNIITCFSNLSCAGVWSDWSKWSDCNVSCGIGVMNKSRICFNDSTLCVGEYYNISTCFSNESCAGVWSDWSQWSDCNVSCGIGVMNKSRICFNDSELCVGENYNITTCFSNLSCAGVWSDWSEWSDCNVLCGMGVMNKSRICFNDSKLCVGESYNITTCISNLNCAGVWSDWSEWSDCDVSCGIGVMNKSRICFNDSKLCVGESYNITTCFSNLSCAGVWSDWSEWSDCNVSCGIGVMNKLRICFNDSRLCIGESYNITTCFSNLSCAGIWSDWSQWSDCNVSCGIGVMNKSRTCFNNSKLCVGESYNITTCFSDASCAGVWSDWSEWSSCNVSCGIGVMNKSRICFNDSKLCVGESYNITTCFSNVSCAGIWSDWSDWSDCNVSCGIGVMNKSRICFNDSKLCVGESYNISTCFRNVSCAGIWSDWSEWSDCNVSCGIGVKNKSRICFNDSKLCVGESYNITTCFSNLSCAGECDFLLMGLYMNVTQSIVKDMTFEMVFMFQKIYNNGFGVVPRVIELDFGDGTLRNISDQELTENQYYLNYSTIHSYNECGKYKISYTVKPCNASLHFNYSENNFINMTAFCTMSPFTIATNPASDSFPYFVLPLKQEISLAISQSTGSYLTYTVNWGDNALDISDQSSSKNPIPFSFSHTYEGVSSYVIVVEAKNALEAISNKIFIQIQNCSFPQIVFHYGTVKNQLQVFYNTTKDFPAYIKKVDNLCNSTNISFDWLINGENIKIKSHGVLTDNKIVYSIENNLDYGSYTLSLFFTYNKLTTVYISYFIVVGLPFYIEIENGEFHTVAYKELVGNEWYHRILTLSALVSIDTNPPKLEYETVVYNWRCKLASNLSFAQGSLMAHKSVNSSSIFCFNQSWVDLELFGPEIVLNTDKFLEGVTYQFQVVGTLLVGKYLQFDSFIQEIFFSPGDLPKGKIICITNCGKKLNIRDHLIYMFTCMNCDENLLTYSWQILTDDNQWPEELLQENSTTTGFKGGTLVINVETLVASKNYTFLLTVSYVGSSYNALFKIKKETSSLPVPGSCFISPQIGYMILTKFKIICQDWKDEEQSILKYHFYYDIGIPEKFLITSNENMGYPLLNAKSTEQPFLIDFVLPPGKIYNNFTIAILIKVIGFYNAFMQYHDLYVQVLPFENTLSISNIFSTINTHYTNTMSSFLQAVCHYVNENSYTVKSLNVESVDNITGFSNVNRELLLEKENMLNQLQNARSKVVDLLVLAPLNSLNEIKDVGDILSVVLDVPEELNPQTVINSIDIVTKMASLLSEENIKNVGPHVFDFITQPYITCISNLFDAISYSNNSVDFKSGNEFSTSKKINEGSIKLLQSLEVYLKALQYFIAENEDPIIGDTPGFRFFVKKVYGNSKENTSTSSSQVYEQSGFTLPSLNSFLNESIKHSSVVVNNINMKNQLFTWDLERSKNIVSESQIIYLSMTTGKKIEVKNLSSTVNISIKNIPEKIKGQNVSLLIPNDVQLALLELQSVECKFLLKITPLNDPHNRTNLIVYIQYGKIPKTSDYDIKLNISNRDGTVLTLGNNSPSANHSLNIQRNQKCRLMDDGSVIMWDFINSTYSFLNRTILYLSYFYNGPMPDKIFEINPYTFDKKEFIGAFYYEIKSFCVECNYWNEKFNKWMSDGCEVDLFTNTFSITQCNCNHLTAFGGFYVAPNKLPTPTLSLLKSGYVLLIVVCSVIFLWLSGLVFARRIDKIDIQKVGVCPLVDNCDTGCYLYQITVVTGSRKNAGTKSNIFFTIAGELGDSGVRRLKDSKRDCFQRSSVDMFIMKTTSCFGDLNYMRVWHDNTGGGWYLRDIEVIDLQTDKYYYFIANRWIAVEYGSLDIVLPLCDDENLRNFSFFFFSKTRKGFTDDHLWLSIFTRLPISSFTRCQRLSVAISLLMTSMASSAIFFGRVPPSSPATENKVGAFSFTLKQIYVGMVCAIITIPVNLLLTQLFRLIEPVYQNGNISKSHDLFIENKESNFSSIEKDLYKKSEKPFYLPHYFLYISWILCVGTILGLGYVILLYGMSFGNKKSLDWLSSVTLGLIHDTMLIQPTKIFLFALLYAFASKVTVYKEKYVLYIQGKTLAHNESWLHSNMNEEITSNQISTSTAPPTKSSIKIMKEARLLQLKLYSTAWELLLYCLFSIVVFYLGYMSKEKSSYFQTRDVEELFNLKLRTTTKVYKNFQVLERLQSSEDFWSWIDFFFLPIIHPEPWFNLSDKFIGTEYMDFPGKTFLPDLTSKVINGIRIRQVRVKPDSCVKPTVLTAYIKLSCLSAYKALVEETQNFDLDWTRPTISNKSQSSTLSLPWKYQTSEELDGYSFSSALEVYGGGGYVIEIFPKRKNQIFINQLKQKKWIDRQSRALIFEFALFNAATNYFNMVTLTFEFPPFGGILTYFNVNTFMIYASTTEHALGVIGSQIFFLLMTLIFAIREFKIFYRKGWSYFIEFWNVVEAFLFFLSLLAVCFFIYKGQLAKKLMSRLQDKQPENFINFMFALHIDSNYTCVVSLIVFFVNLKFLKLLRFNRRVSLLSSTLKVAFYPLLMIGIVFILIVWAVVLFSNIAFGSFLDGYQTHFQTVTSIGSLLLGKFSFETFAESPILGPIFFFGFNFFMVWIFMNMLISILNDSMASVHSNKNFQNNDYEIIDYFVAQFKGLLSLDNKKNTKNVPLNINCKQLQPESSLICTSENLNDCGFVSKVSFHENTLMEQDDDEIMSKILEKFVSCLILVHNRNILKTIRCCERVENEAKTIRVGYNAMSRTKCIGNNVMSKTKFVDNNVMSKTKLVDNYIKSRTNCFDNNEILLQKQKPMLYKDRNYIN
ncbi:uncharacterized protein LOC101238762 isoform X3 [Hydra vulgaris]|uniref:Uncharacterized protein LOC101238762 isoform X3 n=2 Tax=Hydra vulgaris TaxID=6087 RepID=A0ABM4C5G4_HYDVU